METRLAMRSYTATSDLIYGSETRTFKENLKQYGCHYNATLKVGPGWLINKYNIDGILKVRELIIKIQEGVDYELLKVKSTKTRIIMTHNVPNVGATVLLGNGREATVISLEEDNEGVLSIICLNTGNKYVCSPVGLIKMPVYPEDTITETLINKSYLY